MTRWQVELWLYKDGCADIGVAVYLLHNPIISSPGLPQQIIHQPFRSTPVPNLIETATTNCKGPKI